MLPVFYFYVSYKEGQMFDISKLVTEDEKVLAHINGAEDKETLKQHLDKTIYYFYKLDDEKLQKIIKNVISEIKFNNEKLSPDIQNNIFDMFISAIYLHDIGKINPSYQLKLHNKVAGYENLPEYNDSRHSLLSALLYTQIWNDKISELSRKQKGILRTFIYYFSYDISRHHTYLENIEEKEYMKELKNLKIKIDRYPYYIKFYNQKDKIRKFNLNLMVNRENKGFEIFSMYILVKLLYSTIVTCDFYATYNYMTGKEIDFNYIKESEKYIDKFKNTSIYKGIQCYKEDKGYFAISNINSLRSELFIESENNLKKNMDKNIYYLEAPTGSGKTNASINLALNIVNDCKDINKIFYIFPFNTLMEQTQDAIKDVFDGDIGVINSITPIKTIKESNGTEEYIDYGKSYLDRQMLHYPVTLTSHVNLFNYLFGTGREINLPLLHLCNSVIIMDEIQSYRNDIWPEIISFWINTASC